MEEYKSHDDWYDNGPGSENMKRKIKQGTQAWIKQEWDQKAKERDEVKKIAEKDKKQKEEIKKLKKKVKELEEALKERDALIVRYVPVQEIY